MMYFAGIDVSLEESSICLLDAGGKIVREVKVASEPEALVGFIENIELVVSRIGLSRMSAGDRPIAETRARDWLPGSYLTRVMWRRHCRPRTEARTRRRDTNWRT